VGESVEETDDAERANFSTIAGDLGELT
jgi:hypothetical protein